MKTHIIIFHDKSRRWIGNKTYQDILSDSMKNDKIILDGNYIKYSSIAKILTKEEFEKEYPKEYKGADPATPLLKIPREKYISIEQRAKKRQRAYKSMLRGLKNFIDREMKAGVTPHNAIAMYNDKLSIYKKEFKTNV